MTQTITKWFITRDVENELIIKEKELYHMMPVNRVPGHTNRLYPYEVKTMNGIKYMCTYDDQNHAFLLVAKIDSNHFGFTSLNASDEENVKAVAEAYITMHQ